LARERRVHPTILPRVGNPSALSLSDQHGADVHVGLVVAQLAFMCPVGPGIVAGSHPEDAGADYDLPTRPFAERPGVLDDGGKQVGGRSHEFGRGERWAPQFADVRQRLFVSFANRFCGWDAPHTGRRRARPGKQAGLARGLPRPPACGAARSAEGQTGSKEQQHDAHYGFVDGVLDSAGVDADLGLVMTFR